jgi:hypothetical protein
MNLEESQKENEDIDEMKARIFRGLLLNGRFEDLCGEFDDITKPIDKYGSNLLWMNKGAELDILIRRLWELRQKLSNYRKTKDRFMTEEYGDERDDFVEDWYDEDI